MRGLHDGAEPKARAEFFRDAVGFGHVRGQIAKFTVTRIETHRMRSIP